MSVTNNRRRDFGKLDMNILGTPRCHLYPKVYYKKITAILAQSEPSLTPKRRKEELDSDMLISKPPASIPRQAAPQAMAYPYLSAQAWSCVSN